MFSRGVQSTLTPEVPRRKNRKGLSTSGHDLSSMGQQKYDRDALAFNHYVGYLKQPLRRHLSSDITYLVPSMPIQLNDNNEVNQPSKLVNYDVNQSPATKQYDNRPPLAKTPEPIYSAPRRQRSFRKQRSLDNPTNDTQLIALTNSSNSGPNETINPIGYPSVTSSSVPHLPQQSNQPQSPQQQLVQQKPLGYPLKPISVSTEGLIQHIISQQSQIERLSKQQDFLTQQLLTSRETSGSDSASKRNGRSRARSRSTSSKTHHDSLSSLEPVKRRSSSREKIQEQLHAQQARVQRHIQQLEAQLELIRDIRTGSSTRHTSRSHSRAPSMRDGSSCPPEDEQVEIGQSTRSLSADPNWLKSVQSPQLESESKQLKSNNDNTVLPTIITPVPIDGTTNSSDQQQSVSKPRLMLTNPSEESKDDETSIAGGSEINQSSSKLIVNRPALIDQDDGIPFMDDELIDEGPDGNESDELETVFEFDRSEKKSDYQDGEEIDEEYDDWEDDDELDYYSRDMASPQAETDPWSRLMEEDIIKAREEMDRQRSLMDRQEMDLSDQRQFITMETDERINLVPGQPNNQQLKQNQSENQTLTTLTVANQMRYSPQMVNQQIDQTINQNLIPITQSRSRLSSPLLTSQQQPQPLISGNKNYSNRSIQENIFNFNERDTKQFQSQLTSSNMINQQQRLSPIHTNQQQSSNLINQQHQISISSGSSFSPVIINRLNRDGNEGGGGIGPPKIIDRQMSTPVSSTNNQTKSPNTNYIKRPSFEDQQSDTFIQSSILRSKMLIPSPINLGSSNQFNQPLVPPRRKPVTPRSRSPIQGTSSVTSPSYRIQTNKNRMAGQQIISSPRRPQRSTSQADQQMITNSQQSNQQQHKQSSSYMIRSTNLSPTINQPHLLVNQQQQQQFNQPFTSSVGSTNLGGRLTPRVYSPQPTTAPTTINRPESMFRPIASNQLKPNTTATPIIKIDPARSTSNLNLSSSSPSFNNSNNQLRRSPSPQSQQSTSSASSFLKRAGSFIQRNTNFMSKNQSKNQDHNQKHQQQQLRRSPSPLSINSAPSITISSQLSSITNLSQNNQSGNTLKVDLQSIRSNRSSRASSPVPPPIKDPPKRKIFINKDTVEAGSFTDHFNHYYAKQPEPNRRPLSQQFTHSSTGEINKIGRSITPMRDIGHHSGKQSVDSQPSLRRTPSNHSNHKTTNQSTANALIDAPIHYERRQTLPEITKGLGVEDKTTAKEEAILRSLAGKKKHSLPQDDLHEVPMIPGWEREKVATLAHEAREARMNQPTGPVVHLTAVTNWLIKYKFVGLIIFFNAILFYLFMRILQPIDDQINENESKST